MSYCRHIFHLVTRTKDRKPSLPENAKRVLFSYILRICQSHGWQLYRINGYMDHIHILIGLPSTVMPQDVMRVIKSQTTGVFRRHELFPEFDGWGEGYGSFTVSYSDIDRVKNYIINQEEHHSRVNTDVEYRNLLCDNGLM